MTKRALLACALALAIPAAALADPPGRVTIVAVFNPITYGETAYVNGQLVADNQGGQLVALEQSPPPYTDWTPVLQTTSDAAGYYSFKLLHPSQTMQYRTNSQGTPSERTVQVDVAPRIKLAASAAGKTSVRFSGTFAPALDGQSVAIQRRGTGGWTTVANARLHGGKTFQGRLRAHKPVILRAMFASDGAHLDGFSNSVRAVPGVAAHSATAAAACAPPRITRIAFKPEPPVAGSAATLRVSARLAGGRIYAIDVRWGERDTRDHFTLAPSYRKPLVTFALRHRYEQAGSYKLVAKVYAIRRGCKSSAVRTLARAVAAPH